MDLRFPDAVFRADQGRRLLSGLLVPWDKPARSQGIWYVFRPDSLHWSEVSRIKLNKDHERHELVGVATSLRSTSEGLLGVFRVATGDAGDETLRLAEEQVVDGFSVEVDFEDGDVVRSSPHILEGKRVQEVTRGTLRGVACTAHPAYDDARITAVAASRDARLEIRLDQDQAEGVKAAADQAGVSISELVRGQLRHYATQRPVYPLDGSPGPSLVRDWWVRNHPQDGDAFAAQDRLNAHLRFERQLQAQFATATTVTDPELVPPGYKPLIASIEADRPLFAASSKGDIANGAPFTCPANITETAVGTGAATHTEGVQPTEGTMALTGATVTTTSVSGTFRVTRELVDSSSPALDTVAFQVMREDYNRQVETMIFTELNGTNGQGGTITAGLVPSGAQARVSTGAALPADLRKAILTYVDVRKQKARSVVASSRTAVAEALETLDLTHWALKDVSVELSPWITGTAAGDGDLFILGTSDLWVWSSPLLEFSYRERQGPALIDLAIYGYVAVRLVKPQGLATIRHT